MEPEEQLMIWTAIVQTEASDSYVFLYSSKPTCDEVVRRVYEIEQQEDLEFYTQTCYVVIENHYVEKPEGVKS